MKALIQRVKRANVKINKDVFGKIEEGLVVFLGIAEKDSEKDADWLLNKIINLRIFPDESGKMDKNLRQIKGDFLVVSQFTLLGNCNKGRRPSFDKAANPDKAKSLYDYFIRKAREKRIDIVTGKFGEFMQVELVNNGPVTFIIDTEK